MKSETLLVAGEKGFIPMSFDMAAPFLGIHWLSVEEGAQRSGKTAKRSDWRIVREVFVADTDEETFKHSLEGMMGRMYRDYFLPLFNGLGLIPFFTHAPDVAISDVTPEYCAEHNWFVGSPQTVAEKIEKLYHDIGGFGTVIVHAFDYKDNPEPWRRSMELIGTEVVPRLKHLMGDNLN